MRTAAQDCFGDVEELPVSEWDRVMRVNVTSCLLTAKFCVPLMRQRGGGSIINVSSVSGLANQRKAMVYSVSKAALISLTKSEGAPESSRLGSGPLPRRQIFRCAVSSLFPSHLSLRAKRSTLRVTASAPTRSCRAPSTRRC